MKTRHNFKNAMSVTRFAFGKIITSPNTNGAFPTPPGDESATPTRTEVSAREVIDLLSELSTARIACFSFFMDIDSRSNPIRTNGDGINKLGRFAEIEAQLNDYLTAFSRYLDGSTLYPTAPGSMLQFIVSGPDRISLFNERLREIEGSWVTNGLPEADYFTQVKVLSYLRESDFFLRRFVSWVCGDKQFSPTPGVLPEHLQAQAFSWTKELEHYDLIHSREESRQPSDGFRICSHQGEPGSVVFPTAILPDHSALSYTDHQGRFFYPNREGYRDERGIQYRHSASLHAYQEDPTSGS